jgi:uncharacterized membrane protein YkoI
MLVPPVSCRPVLVGLLGLVLAQAPATGSDGPRVLDQDRARSARALDQVLPLIEILKIVERDFHGRVIEVELEMEGGQLVYEIELLLRDGRLIEVEFDARTAELLKVKGNRLETVFKARPDAAPARR